MLARNLVATGDGRFTAARLNGGEGKVAPAGTGSGRAARGGSAPRPPRRRQRGGTPAGRGRAGGVGGRRPPGRCSRISAEQHRSAALKVRLRARPAARCGPGSRPQVRRGRAPGPAPPARGAVPARGRAPGSRGSHLAGRAALRARPGSPGPAAALAGLSGNQQLQRRDAVPTVRRVCRARAFRGYTSRFYREEERYKILCLNE